MQGKAQRLKRQGGASKALDLGDGGPHSRRNLEQPSIKPLQYTWDQLPMGPVVDLIGFMHERTITGLETGAWVVAVQQLPGTAAIALRIEGSACTWAAGCWSYFAF